MNNSSFEVKNSLPIRFCEGLKESGGKEPVLLPFLTDEPEKHGSVLIIPGGGYEHVSLQKEGTAVAEALNGEGLNAFVLDYRTAPSGKDAIMGDAVRAVRFIRYYREIFGTDPGRLAVMGFSAGGHLALMTAQHHPEVRPGTDEIERESGKPDALILCYPVVTFCEPFLHRNSRRNFLGAENAEDPALQKRYSAEKHIGADFPPSFVWHCRGDASVPVENSIMLCEALSRAGVDHRSVLYDGGAHGLGLAPGDPVIAGWFGDCVTWLREKGY